MASDDDFFRGFAVRRERWTIAGEDFDLCWPADMDSLLDLSSTIDRFEREGYMPYWASLWPASVMLAEKVLRVGGGGGRPAVEIGCGVGLVSLAAARAGWSVTAGDYDADALTFVTLNAERNGISLESCRLIDFREPLDRPCYDCVLAADLLYEKQLLEPLARWVASALRPGGFGWISDSNRAVADAFPEEARRASLRTSVEAVSTRLLDGSTVEGRIWRVEWP